MTELKQHQSEQNMRELKRKNKNLLERLKFWQNFKYVKPLICRKCNVVLNPKESKQRIILKCPECGYIQTYIPPTILKTKLDFPTVLTKNQNKNSRYN